MNKVATVSAPCVLTVRRRQLLDYSLDVLTDGWSLYRTSGPVVHVVPDVIVSTKVAGCVRDSLTRETLPGFGNLIK